MTLDEKIEEQRENAKAQREMAEEYFEEHIIDEKEKIEHLRYANEFDQLAEWLEELKEFRNLKAGHLYAVAFNKGYLKAEKEVREKTIDDFARKLITHFADWELSNTPCNDDETDRTKEIICETIENAIGGVEEIAEQLKAGGDNESK